MALLSFFQGVFSRRRQTPHNFLFLVGQLAPAAEDRSITARAVGSVAHVN
jgi:hypothetical protein